MQYFLMIWFNRTLTILILYLLCTCIHFLSIYQHERSITIFNKISSPYSHDIDVHLLILRKTLSSSLQRNKCLLIQNIFSTFQQITSTRYIQIAVLKFKSTLHDSILIVGFYPHWNILSMSQYPLSISFC